MKLSEIGKKSTIYEQTLLEKGKVEESSVRRRADAGAQKMKEQHVVDDSEPAASPTMIKERRTVMSENFK